MHVKLLSVKLNHFQSNGPFKHTTFHFQKYNSEHKIRSQLCSRPPNIRAVVVAGKHIWNRKLVRRGNLCQHWGENLPWSPPCQEKWKKIKKLWVNRYSQNRTLSWASARLKCKPHTHKLGRSGSECVFKKQSNDVRFDQIDFLLWNGGMWWEKSGAQLWPLLPTTHTYSQKRTNLESKVFFSSDGCDSFVTAIRKTVCDKSMFPCSTAAQPQTPSLCCYSAYFYGPNSFKIWINAALYYITTAQYMQNCVQLL